MTPTQDYGYVLIPPGQHARFCPLRYDDECWLSTSRRWVKTDNSPGQGFSAGMTYRRKIDAGDGWEIVPGHEPQTLDMEYFDARIGWTENVSIPKEDNRCDCYIASACRFLAFRRRIQPKSEWVEMKTKNPMVGQKVWFYGEVFGIIMAEYIGGFTTVTHWRPVNPGEIPEPPKVEPVKSQAELDSEASKAWYQNHSDTADELCEEALRVAYIAGLRDGRAK